MSIIGYTNSLSDYCVIEIEIIGSYKFDPDYINDSDLFVQPIKMLPVTQINVKH